MSANFWKLKKPIIVSAPMANVTDAAFRIMLAKYGKPDITWTEFVSCDGLMSEGRENILIDLEFDNKERPVVAQIFGSKPKNFYSTAQLLQELGVDGIDINMGCPDRNVEKQGSGAALMKNPSLAAEIIRETKRGAGKLPVSVKTRIGYSKNQLPEWLPVLLEEEPAAVTVHARTRKELSLVPANWERVAEAVEIRDKMKSKALILGNGDIVDLDDAFRKADDTGADGVMVGRGLLGNPWFFAGLADRKKGKSGLWPPTVQSKLMALSEHTLLFEKLLRPQKSFDIMKKHYKAYVTGFPGAKELRIKLMAASNGEEVEQIVQNYLR